MTAPPDPLADDLDDLVDRIADEFTDRCHRGERPDVEEYATRFPAAAGILRQLLGTVRALGVSTPGSLDGGPPPTRVGAYEVLELLGRGGMGVVYKARDTRLDRVVALKLLRPGGDERERFLLEGRAVARLRHPHIVQVFEVGEADGRPFLALEYLPGGSLAGYLAAHRMTPVESAGLIENVADAVHAAHEAGIVHRDLKPGNILLNAECGTRNAESKTEDHPFSDSAFRVPHSALVPKVTDFGLAKRLGDAGGDHTRSGAIVGTPGYMAPEQAGAGGRLVGPAADVYALGAVLYQCLTGKPPFEGDSTLEVLERVRTADPVPPRRLDGTIPRDLETICLKCLRKEPHERYATAAGLADDLRRFREGRPVLARPVGPGSRAWRLCRRNPVVAGLIAAVAVLLLTGLIAVTALWRKAEENLALARDRERDLNAALTFAGEQRQLAEERGEQERINFSWAQEAVDEMLTHVGEGLENVPQAESARRRVLEKALAMQQRFLAHRSADPTVRLELARAHYRSAHVYKLLGQPGEARSAAEAGLAVLRESAEPPTPERTAEEARLTSARGSALFALRTYAEAARDQRAARALYERVLAENPTQAKVRHRAAQNDQDLGLCLMLGGDYPAAAEAYQSAVRHLDALPADSPEVRSMPARTLNRIGSLMRSSGRLGEAAGSFTAAAAIAGPLADEFPDRRDYRQELASILFNHGNVVVTNGKSGAEEALGLYGRALERYRALSRDFPQDPSYRGAQAGCLFGRGMALARLSRAGDSRADYEEAIREYQALQSAFPRIGGTYSDAEFRVRLNLFNLLLAEKDTGAAEVCLGQLARLASQAQASAPGAADPVHFQGQVAGKRAALLDARSELKEAVSASAEAVALHRKARSMVPRSNRYAVSLRTEHLQLAGLLTRLGRYSELRTVADDLAGDFPTDWEAQYESAGLIGRAVSLAKGDRPFADEATAAAVERLTTAAELFRRGGKVEDFAARVRANDDLIPLRDHPAYKAVLAGSE